MASLPTKQAELLVLPDGSKLISTRTFVPELVLHELREQFATSANKWLRVYDGTRLCFGSGNSNNDKRKFRKRFYELKRIAALGGTPIVGEYSGGRLERFKLADLSSNYDRQLLGADLANAERRAELGQQTVEAIQLILDLENEQKTLVAAG